MCVLTLGEILPLSITLSLLSFYLSLTHTVSSFRSMHSSHTCYPFLALSFWFAFSANQQGVLEKKNPFALEKGCAHKQRHTVQETVRERETFLVES